MNLLALDAATTACSVACWSGGAIIAQREETAGRRQAEILMPMLQSAMREASFDYNMLDLIHVRKMKYNHLRPHANTMNP